MQSAGATVPRNFKLLDELDEAERSTKGGADVSLGLAQNDDSTLSYWNCSIFAQAGGGEPRMWSMSIFCDKDYPTKPPVIKFSSKVSMDCVDAKGNVSGSRGPGEGVRGRSGFARRARGRRR
jgi:ubiquitin-conjugating enzyme E2 variant